MTSGKETIVGPFGSIYYPNGSWVAAYDSTKRIVYANLGSNSINYIVGMNVDTGIITTKPTSAYNPSPYAYDKSRDKTYIVIQQLDLSAPKFGTIDLTTATVNYIGDTDYSAYAMVISMTIASEIGILYATF